VKTSSGRIRTNQGRSYDLAGFWGGVTIFCSSSMNLMLTGAIQYCGQWNPLVGPPRLFRFDRSNGRPRSPPALFGLCPGSGRAKGRSSSTDLDCVDQQTDVVSVWILEAAVVRGLVRAGAEYDQFFYNRSHDRPHIAIGPNEKEPARRLAHI
jgi:hypothetical protein